MELDTFFRAMPERFASLESAATALRAFRHVRAALAQSPERGAPPRYEQTNLNACSISSETAPPPPLGAAGKGGAGDRGGDGGVVERQRVLAAPPPQRRDTLEREGDSFQEPMRGGGSEDLKDAPPAPRRRRRSLGQEWSARMERRRSEGVVRRRSEASLAQLRDKSEREAVGCTLTEPLRGGGDADPCGPGTPQRHRRFSLGADGHRDPPRRLLETAARRSSGAHEASGEGAQERR